MAPMAYKEAKIYKYADWEKSMGTRIGGLSKYCLISSNAFW